jgi:hypothetical protein
VERVSRRRVGQVKRNKIIDGNFLIAMCHKRRANERTIVSIHSFIHSFAHSLIRARGSCYMIMKWKNLLGVFVLSRVLGSLRLSALGVFNQILPVEIIQRLLSRERD